MPAPTFMETTPMELRDFSGGLTDNFLQGAPNRFARGDNFFLTTDHKLEERSGTQVYDPTGYQLAAGFRVGGLFSAISESYLFGHSNQDIYTQSPDSSRGTAWAKVLGPTGNSALGSGTPYARLTTAEFQRQVYYASDAATLPGKIFRDSSNSWKAVTAGMPYLASTPNYPDDASLLSACITLANALRTSMISHFTDVGGLTSGQHVAQDKWSLSYFQTVTWSGGDPENPGPSPTPTPAPAATDATSLYALCLAISLAYEHHRNDLSGSVPAVGKGAKLLHHTIKLYLDPNATSSWYEPKNLGINSRLGYPGTINSLTRAAAFLDDVAQKWYWHQLSPFSHDAANNLTLMSRYLLSTPNQNSKVGTIYSSSKQLQVTPNYTDLFAYAWYIQSVWNAHINNAGWTSSSGSISQHAQTDSYGPINLSPYDYDAAVLIIFWARWLYSELHFVDAYGHSFTKISASTTSGSTSLTSVKDEFGSPTTLTTNKWIHGLSIFGAYIFNASGAGDRYGTGVTASGSGTATTIATGFATSSNLPFSHTSSRLHSLIDPNFILTFKTGTSTAPADATIATGSGLVPTNLSGWINAGTEFITCFGAHLTDGLVHGAQYANMVDQLKFLSVNPYNGNTFYQPRLASYSWAAFYRNQYVVEPNGILYVNNGPPVYSDSLQVFQSLPVGTVLSATDGTYFPAITITQSNASATINNIPALANTALTNYDTTVSVIPTTATPTNAGYNQNLTVELYRTADGGTTFYHLASATNGTTSYADTINEAYPLSTADTLTLQETMYTSGGVLASEPPPQCKFIHEFNGFTYYGAIYDTGQFFPQRVRQSIALAPDWAPATCFDDLEDDLIGLSSTRSNLLGLCKNSIYRFSGSFDRTGGGYMSHERIADSKGCIATRSIVKTEEGVFYAGADGFYFTDGFQNVKISMELNRTYAALTQTETQSRRIYGAYDKLTRRVWWAMQSQPYGQDCDVVAVFYLDYGIKPSGVFTKAFTTLSWMPASICLFKGEMVIGDSRGYLFKTDSFTKTDPKIDTTTTPDNWQVTYVPWAYRSCAMDMGTAARRKWVTKIHFTGQNVGNIAMQITSINDAGTLPDGTNSELPLAPVQYTRNLMWGDPRVIWGDATVAWKYDGTVDFWRRFPARSFRSNFKAVEFTPGNFVVYKYDDYPEFSYCAVNSTTKTATIATPSGYTSILWPLDVVDYYIAFEGDDYVQTYLITALDATKKIVTFADSGNLSVTSTASKWQITGVKKNQRVRITSFDIHMAMLGTDFEAYPGATGASGYGANQ